MLIGPLFSYFLFVSLCYGDPVNKLEEKANLSAPVPTKIQNNGFNKTKLTFASEGEVIFSNTATLALPKENLSFLMTPDKAISSNKIKGRKGAILEDNEHISIEQNNSTASVKQSIKNNVIVNDGVHNNTNVSLNSSLSSSQPNITAIYKPSILSAEAIAKADLSNNDPAVDDIDERTIKVHKMSTNSHPGMIMPIVITVLVVPMFAVIGYMALKRGQEAWKNRHYKRMDFLLDGMYND